MWPGSPPLAQCERKKRGKKKVDVETLKQRSSSLDAPTVGSLWGQLHYAMSPQHCTVVNPTMCRQFLNSIVRLMWFATLFKVSTKMFVHAHTVQGEAACVLVLPDSPTQPP